MHWVIQENFYHEDGIELLVTFLGKMGIPFTEVKVVPFAGDVLPDVNVDGDVVCIGSYSMRKTAKKKNWYPGVFDIEYFDYTKCVAAWGDEMLNADSQFVKFKDVVPLETSDFFIRPIHDSKNFSGRTTSKSSFLQWQYNVIGLGKIGADTLSGDTEVMVSPIKDIYSEYRFWIVDGKIVTSSQYVLGNRVVYSTGAPDNVMEYVRDMLKIHSLDIPFVFDVCETSKGMRIVELNTMNASGFYAGEVDKIVMALEDKYSGETVAGNI